MSIKIKSKELTTTNNVDNSNVAAGGDNSIAIGSGAAVNFLDGGAIGEAFGFGSDALDFSRGISSAAFDFAQHSNDQAVRNLTEGTMAVLDKVTIDSGQRIQAVTETFGKYAIYAGIAIAALFMFRKG